MEDDYSIAERIKKLRTETHKTQKEVSHYLNTDDGTYRKWERGDRVPMLPIIRSLCIFYDVSADYFLGLIDDPIPLERQRIKGEK